MEMEIKEGMIVKGFKFQDNVDGIEYHPVMDKYIGVKGTLMYMGSDYYTIQFGNVNCSYPLSMIHESVLSVGDKIKIPKTKSVGKGISSSNAVRKAIKLNQDYLYFTGMEYSKLMLNSVYELGHGDYFALSDIELY
jgi:hypothetical protein